MRVGIVALMHESNTFHSTPTTMADFQRDWLLHGEEIRTLEGAHHEVGGFLEGLRLARIEAVPILAARATPAGPIDAPTFQQLLATIERLERFGALDGILVAPHGAAVSEGAPDADGTWLTRLRSVAGSKVPIIGTLDPHANLSPAMIAATDALIAYQTNPHLDQRDRGLEAARLIARTLRGEIRPTQAAEMIPLIINIERQRTDEPHLVEQRDFADQLRERPGVLSASLVLGFPYADVAEMGTSVVVVTDNDPERARQLAEEWGQFLWSRREQFVGTLISVDRAMQFVAEHDGPICLLDMGDNVGGGSPGDGTILVHELHRNGLMPALVCLTDPETVLAADRAGPGSVVSLDVGGKTDARHGPPFRGEFQVVRIVHGEFQEAQARHGGIQQYHMGRSAVLRSPSGLTLLVMTHRVPPFSLGQITSVGLDPAAFRVLVAKGVHAPVAAYAPVCRHLVRVNTPGVTAADLSLFPFRNRRRSMFPFERDAFDR